MSSDTVGIHWVKPYTMRRKSRGWLMEYPTWEVLFEGDPVSVLEMRCPKDVMEAFIGGLNGAYNLGASKGFINATKIGTQP